MPRASPRSGKERTASDQQVGPTAAVVDPNKNVGDRAAACLDDWAQRRLGPDDRNGRIPVCGMNCAPCLASGEERCLHFRPRSAGPMPPNLEMQFGAADSAVPTAGPGSIFFELSKICGCLL